MIQPGIIAGFFMHITITIVVADQYQVIDL